MNQRNEQTQSPKPRPRQLRVKNPTFSPRNPAELKKNLELIDPVAVDAELAIHTAFDIERTDDYRIMSVLGVRVIIHAGVEELIKDVVEGAPDQVESWIRDQIVGKILSAA